MRLTSVILLPFALASPLSRRADILTCDPTVKPFPAAGIYAEINAVCKAIANKSIPPIPLNGEGIILRKFHNRNIRFAAVNMSREKSVYLSNTTCIERFRKAEAGCASGTGTARVIRGAVLVGDTFTFLITPQD